MITCHHGYSFHSLVHSYCALGIRLVAPTINDGDMTANVPAINTIARKIALVDFLNTILINITICYTLIYLKYVT